MDQLFPSSIAEDLEAVVHAGVVAATASEHVETWSGAVGAVDPAPTRSRAPGPKVRARSGPSVRLGARTTATYNCGDRG